MPNQILLSIIIPVYNVENYICECLNSILSQVEPHLNQIEIIIINDGSLDESWAIVNEIVNQYKGLFIKLLEQTNRGLSAARNIGIESSNGKYIWFIDSDDWIEYNAISEILPLVHSEKYDIINIGYGLCFEDGRCEKKYLSSSSGCKNGTEVLKESSFPMGAQFYIINKSFLEVQSLRFEEGIYHEDNLFTPLLLLKSKSFYFHNSLIYMYRQRLSGSILTTKMIKKSYDLLKIANILLENSKKTDAYHNLYYRYMGLAITASLNNAIGFIGTEEWDIYKKYLFKNRYLFFWIIFSCKIKYSILGFVGSISPSLVFVLFEIFKKNRNR